MYSFCILLKIWSINWICVSRWYRLRSFHLKCFVDSTALKRIEINVSNANLISKIKSNIRSRCFPNFISFGFFYDSFRSTDFVVITSYEITTFPRLFLLVLHWQSMFVCDLTSLWVCRSHSCTCEPEHVFSLKVSSSNFSAASFYRRDK